MNTITQIYEEHASMPPHDGSGKKMRESENLINYLLHDGEYVVLCFIAALHFFATAIINSSSQRRRFCFSQICGVAEVERGKFFNY